MSPPTGDRVVVFHAGALGDFVMIWPLLRALRAARAGVRIIAPAGHAALAERELGVRGIGSERAWVTGLWREEGRVQPCNEPGADLVISFVADDVDEAGRRWCANVRRALGCDRLVCVGPPGSEGRLRLWREAEVSRLGGVARQDGRDGPAVLHAGAGAREKMWPLEKWGTLAEGLRRHGWSVSIIAGEVEEERFRGDDHERFAAMGGRFLRSLDGLAAAIRPARVYAGADSGPTHLAAQLGVPTVAMFGPTDPGVWAPSGPAVRVVRSADGTMAGLDVEPVLREALALEQGARSARGPHAQPSNA